MLRHFLAGIILLLSVSSSFAQDSPNEQDTPTFFRGSVSNSQVDSLFHANLSEKKLFLFIQGGIASAYFSKSDRQFEKKYKVSYYDFGCVAPGASRYYNLLVFAHLDKRVKSSWQKDVRKDAIGYDIYRKRKQMARRK